MTIESNDLVIVWNEYCDGCNYFDDRISFMYELDDEYAERSATELLNDIDGNNFSGNDDYYKHTIYGIESLGNPIDHIDIDDLVADIVDNDNDYGNEDIRAALDEE